MWCIWKSINDYLFGRKKGEPYQIHINAHALQKNMELLDPSDFSLQAELQLSQSKIQQRVLEEGETLTSDIVISGPRIFSDASCKNQNTSGTARTQATCIGVFIQLKHGGHNFSIKIQVSISPTSSVLQAEARALLLAAEVAKKLRITILTDNNHLAKAVASRKLDSDHMHWDTRDTFAKILNSTSSLQATVFHISREFNTIAHTCAHQVLSNSLSPPILACSSSAHAPHTCPVVSVLKHSEWTGFVIRNVQCC
jgi:ribonuclease HI